MKSPAKNFSLKRLLQIKDEYYSDLDRGIDYVPCEVDELIWEKQKKIKPKLYIVVGDSKWCSSCKTMKPNTAFDKDVSKKLTGLRSHCKICRRKVPF